MGGSKGDVSQVEDTKDVGSSAHVPAIDARALSERPNLGSQKPEYADDGSVTYSLETVEDAKLRGDAGSSGSGEVYRLETLGRTPSGGLDKKPTSRLELYGWACQPFNISQSGFFMPLVLQSLSAQAGVQNDGKTPCDTSVQGYQCKTWLGNILVDPTSFALYIRTIATVIQFFVFVSMGSIADYGNHRKAFLFSFGFLSAITVIIYVTIRQPQYYNWIAVLQIISSISFGASVVFWYAYLPTLIRHHPYTLKAYRVHGEDSAEHGRAVERIGNSLSTHGIVIGYAGALVCLILQAIYLLTGGQSTWNLQIAIAGGGVWYILFMIPSIFWIKPRAGPPLPTGEHYLTFSWKRLYRTFRELKRLKQIFKFLLGWFLLSDGITTIGYIAIFFAKNDVGMSNVQLIIAAALIPLRTKTMLFISITLYLWLPIWGLIGYVTPNFGLKSANEIYAAAVVDGIFVGACNSFARVWFSEMLPPGHENEFFALYEVTDNGATWLGPLVAGAINGSTGGLRAGFWFILAIMAVPLCIFYFVDVDKGRKDASIYSREEEAKTQTR
ncbi:hypothetical protein BZG36_02009 [Bifiguratus adelaidae]|uniref:Autophagy-related protein n=1 Tax=Bifiguratus adelaidae TaxID=1938954 RepID=A0A261Y459_9FUNG|nr:hypothetical protein BZG36_02009 [Bifiguratus adelaidae]